MYNKTCVVELLTDDDSKGMKVVEIALWANKMYSQHGCKYNRHLTHWISKSYLCVNENVILFIGSDTNLPSEYYPV